VRRIKWTRNLQFNHAIHAQEKDLEQHQINICMIQAMKLMLLIFVKLTRSTSMACTQSCLSTWTRNRATSSFWWHPFLSLFCTTWFLCPALLPPWNGNEITNTNINSQTMHPLHSLHYIQVLGMQNRNLCISVCTTVPWIWSATWRLRRTILVLCRQTLVPAITFCKGSDKGKCGDMWIFWVV